MIARPKRGLPPDTLLRVLNGAMFGFSHKGWEIAMNVIARVAIGALVGVSAIAYAASDYVPAPVGHQSHVVEHGGGCRKSSPPGMCCHMDNSTGIVHCH